MRLTGLEHSNPRAERICRTPTAHNRVGLALGTFSVPTNAVTLVSIDGAEQVPLQSKTAVAGRILDRVETLLAGRPATQVG